MPNQYSTPLTRTPQSTYVSQHVGLPLEQMELALAARQKSYDDVDNLGIETKTHLGGIEGYGNYANTYLAKKQKELEEFTKQYDGKDLSLPEVSKAFKEKSSEIAEDPELANIQKGALLAKQFKANLADMKKSGDLYNENVYHHMKALSRYSETGDFGGDFDPSINKGVNIEEEAEKYFKALHANSAESMRKIADGAGGSIYYKDASGGISGSQIYGQAGRMLGEFVQSQAGQQAKRRYMMESDQTGKTPTEQGFHQYAAKLLLNAGAGFQYSDTKSDISTALDKKEGLKRAAKEKKEKENPYMTVPVTEYKTGETGLTLDRSGKVKGDGGAMDQFSETFSRLRDSKGIWGALKEASKDAKNVAFGNKENPLSDEQKKQLNFHLSSLQELNKTRKANGQSLITDPTEYLKAVNRNSGKTQQLLASIPTETKEQNGFKGMLENGAFSGMIAIDPTNPSDKTKTVDAQLREYLGLGQDDPLDEKTLKDNGVHFVGSANGIGLSPRGYVLDIRGHRIYADASSSMGTPGNWHPRSDNDARDINAFNKKQAELKGGVHKYESYRVYQDGPNKGKFMKDEAGNYITTPAVVNYDPILNTTSGRFLKK